MEEKNMNLWKDIATGPAAPEAVYAVIEIPRGHRNETKKWGLSKKREEEHRLSQRSMLKCQGLSTWFLHLSGK